MAGALLVLPARPLLIELLARLAARLRVLPSGFAGGVHRELRRRHAVRRRIGIEGETGDWRPRVDAAPVLVGDLEQLSEALLAHPPRLRARDCHELVALL